MIRLRRPKPQIHRVTLRYPRSALPGAVIHHSGNETHRGGRAGAIEGGIKQALGTLGGFPDLIVFWHGRFWAFEVKSVKGRVLETQESVGAPIQFMGGRWAVVRSVEEVADLVHVWGEGTPIRKVRLT
jgi:uncharacterized membrane protein